MRALDHKSLAGAAESGDLRAVGRLLRLDSGAKLGAVIAAAGAATLNDMEGKVTSEALTTAQNAIYTLTLTNSEIAAADMVFVSISNGTNSAGTPMLGTVVPAAGSVVIQVINKHATAVAFNGTVVVSYFVRKSI